MRMFIVDGVVYRHPGYSQAPGPQVTRKMFDIFADDIMCGDPRGHRDHDGCGKYRVPEHSGPICEPCWLKHGCLHGEDDKSTWYPCSNERGGSP